MSQSTLEDDDLFGEAATEVRDDVEASLRRAREDLPDADAVWDVEAENVLGALNGLRSALDVEEASEALHDAKKWYALGDRADAFEDDDIGAEIESLETLLANVEEAHEQVGALVGTLPELRNSLDDPGELDAEPSGEDSSDEVEAD